MRYTESETPEDLLSVSVSHKKRYTYLTQLKTLTSKGVMWRRETWLLIFLCIPVISGFNVGIKGAKILSGAAGSMLGYSLDFATKGNNVW